MQADKLQILCAKWQKILRLQDWDVKIEFARGYDMDGRAGSNSFTAKNKTAFIRILASEDYSPEIKWPQNIEATVVHELLHLHFAALDDLILPGIPTIILEQAISSLEDAFTKLVRA